MLEFITGFLGTILSSFGWIKIVDENKDNKDTKSDL